MSGLGTWQTIVKKYNFVIPESVPDAEEQFAILVSEIQQIESQLGDRTKRHRALTEGMMDDYDEWRRSAIAAKNFKAIHRRFLKKWITDHKRASIGKMLSVDPNDPMSLLVSALHLFRKLHKEGVEFDDAEFALINLIQAKIGD